MKYKYTVQQVEWLSEGPTPLSTYDDVESAFTECDRLESILPENADTYYEVTVDRVEPNEIQT